MRKKRKPIEDFFCSHVTAFVRNQFEAEVNEVPGILDKPDLVLDIGGRRVAIELSQIPSSYFIRHLHKKIPPPTYRDNEIVGRLSVFPFEPHRWLNEVIKKKHKSLSVSKHRANADEVWLALHAHSVDSDWPMTKDKTQRKFELELMRFGTKGTIKGCDRIIYLYPDGSAAGLHGNGEVIPKRIELVDGEGYPAVTHHSFCFSFDAPFPGLGERVYEFDDIKFQELLVRPKDDWMLSDVPNIKRPDFFVRATVDAAAVRAEIFQDGKLVLSDNLNAKDHNGQKLTCAMVIEKGIRRQRYRSVT